MKKLIFSLALLFTVTILSAQSTPNNYDGGSDLQNAIRKAKAKKSTPKTKTKKAPHTYTVQSTSVQETPEEKLYRIQHGHSSPEYVKRVMASPGYKDEVAEAKRLQEEHDRIYKEQAEQRKADSIADIEKSKQAVAALEKRRKDLIEFNRKQDSIQKAQSDSYIEDQRKQQKANKPRRGIFGL